MKKHLIMISSCCNHSYLADFEQGDPSRTKSKYNAIKFNSKTEAEIRAKELSTQYPNRKFKTIEY